MAQLPRGRTTVTGGLVPDGIVRKSRMILAQRILTLDSKRVETRAQHEMQLLQQHITDGAHLALEAVPIAQQAGVGIGAPVTKGGKLQRHQRQRRQVIGDQIRRLVTAQLHADGITPREQRFPMLLPLLDTDDDGPGRRDLFQLVASWYGSSISSPSRTMRPSRDRLLCIVAVNRFLERRDADTTIGVEETLTFLTLLEIGIDDSAIASGTCSCGNPGPSRSPRDAFWSEEPPSVSWKNS
jgi:hypothetical protein